eukprot:3447467-Lingulodinium_polyedra.AAC.1
MTARGARRLEWIAVDRAATAGCGTAAAAAKIGRRQPFTFIELHIPPNRRPSHSPGPWAASPAHVGPA